MKRSVVVTGLLLLVLGAGGLFAEAQAESSDSQFGPGRRSDGRFGNQEFNAPELVTITGSVEFAENGYPVLTSEGIEYDLMVPRFYTYDIEIPENSVITVEGYLMTAEISPRMDEGENHLQVTKAIIDGKEYELDSMMGRMGMMDDDRGDFGRDSRNSRSPRGRMPMRGGR